MELMLLEPVPNLGDRGDIVRVSAGYARNYLLPKRLAAPVSKAAAQQAEAGKRRAAREEAQRRQALEQVAEKMAATSCTITAAATDEGHLYGSVSAADVAAVLVKEGFEVTESMVKLDEHIKELGVYSVPVTIAPAREGSTPVEATVKVWVVQE